MVKVLGAIFAQSKRKNHLRGDIKTFLKKPKHWLSVNQYFAFQSRVSSVILELLIFWSIVKGLSNSVAKCMKRFLHRACPFTPLFQSLKMRPKTLSNVNFDKILI